MTQEKENQEFISLVAHELRTPLTGIRGYLSMILDGDMGELNPEMRKALNHSYDSSVRLIQLVNDVLTLDKIERGKIQYYMDSFEIVEILTSTYQDIYMEVESRGIEFSIDIDEDLKERKIHIDKDKIKQVFLNLLTNSLKFTSSGWSISLKASKLESEVRFEILDSGEWIPSEKQKELFQKFSQVDSVLQKDNSTGLGIGLALAQNIIEEFDSHIYVKSTPWKGSNFYFDIELITD